MPGHVPKKDFDISPSEEVTTPEFLEDGSDDAPMDERDGWCDYRGSVTPGEERGRVSLADIDEALPHKTSRCYHWRWLHEVRNGVHYRRFSS
jgi:hypothetical protein